MALIDHVNWSKLDAVVTRQQRNRSAHSPVISLFRWWARRPHSFAGALLDAARIEFGRQSFLVADPFSGGGTVAFEASRRSRSQRTFVRRHYCDSFESRLRWKLSS